MTKLTLVLLLIPVLLSLLIGIRVAQFCAAALAARRHGWPNAYRLLP
ncbi:MAG: hypothetical protein WKG07_30910 [Hymenobacter sp.]